MAYRGRGRGRGRNSRRVRGRAPALQVSESRLVPTSLSGFGLGHLP